MPENQTPRLRPRTPVPEVGTVEGAGEATTPEYAAQVALAAMLRTPDRPLLPLVQDAFPSRTEDYGFQSKALKHARDLIQKTIDVLHKPTEDEAAPVLLDRLCFAWRIMRQADVSVWKLKKGELPDTTGVETAREVFRSLLPEPLTAPFLSQVLESLALGPNARYLLHYWHFRRAKAPSPLPAPLGDAGPRNDVENIRRVVRWAIRSHRDRYVQVVAGESIRVEFSHIVEEVLREMQAWTGASPAATTGLADEIEAELNRWLTYSRIEPGAPVPVGDAQEDSSACQIARAFVKFNELNTKIVRIAGTTGPSSRAPDAQTAELAAALAAQEALVRQYSEENRRLEDRVMELEATRNQAAHAGPVMQLAVTPEQELRDVLTLVDSKYSFDALNAVLLGEESHLTIKSFVAHFFYALRKKGFGQYPDEESFDLAYESSGMFECEGFEVPPGGTQRVRVARRGWALRTRDRILPVRRARVVPVA